MALLEANLSFLQVCGGSENLACVYDFVATGSRQMAAASATSSNATRAAKLELGTSPLRNLSLRMRSQRADTTSRQCVADSDHHAYFVSVEDHLCCHAVK